MTAETVAMYLLNQATPRSAWEPLETRKRKGKTALQVSEEVLIVDILTFYFWPPVLRQYISVALSNRRALLCIWGSLISQRRRCQSGAQGQVGFDRGKGMWFGFQSLCHCNKELRRLPSKEESFILAHILVVSVHNQLVQLLCACGKTTDSYKLLAEQSCSPRDWEVRKGEEGEGARVHSPFLEHIPHDQKTSHWALPLSEILPPAIVPRRE